MTARSYIPCRLSCSWRVLTLRSSKHILGDQIALTIAAARCETQRRMLPQISAAHLPTLAMQLFYGEVAPAASTVATTYRCECPWAPRNVAGFRFVPSSDCRENHLTSTQQMMQPKVWWMEAITPCRMPKCVEVSRNSRFGEG